MFLNFVRNKSGKITKIFELLDHLKNQGVIFLAEKIRPVIVMIQHQLQNQLGYHWFCSWCCIITITGLIFSAKNMTPRLLRCSSHPNISVISSSSFLTVLQIARNVGHELWQHYHRWLNNDRITLDCVWRSHPLASFPRLLESENCHCVNRHKSLDYSSDLLN